MTSNTPSGIGTTDSQRTGEPSTTRRRFGGPTSTRFTQVLGTLVLIGFGWLVLFGLFLSPNDANQKTGVRILYIHVPSAWLAYLAFGVTGVCSAGYLWKRTRNLQWDRVAGASAEVGVLFMGITLVSGSLWGKITWLTYWTWDSRLTTTAFLFVTYIGYLAVRDLGGSHHQRARRSAVLALLAVAEVPLVHFSVKWWRPLHQQETVENKEIGGLMLFTLFIGLIAFTLLYVWLVMHRQRVMTIADTFDDRGLDAAIAERRNEEVAS